MDFNHLAFGEQDPDVVHERDPGSHTSRSPSQQSPTWLTLQTIPQAAGSTMHIAGYWRSRSE
jgi:hypothetical protein